MPEDLPIYSESVLRTRSQFADLEKLKSVGTATVWEKSDKFIEQFEGAVDVRHARESLTALTKPNLLHAHAILFSGRENAGILRQDLILPATDEFRAHLLREHGLEIEHRGPVREGRNADRFDVVG